MDSEKTPSLYDIVKCEVSSIKDYGVFVRILGSRKQGLVHKSQISQTRIDNPEEVLSVGDDVYCKVVSIEPDGNKIGFSMKVVNQTTGKDLDPTHLQTSLEEQRKKTNKPFEKQRIELGAVLNTTCKKCGGKGHMANECFYSPGGQTYDLLPAVDDLLQSNAAEQDSNSHSTQKKKKKDKSKKQKRRHKYDEKTDTKKRKKHKKISDSSDSDSDTSNKRRKKHKHKSHSSDYSHKKHKLY